MKKLSLFVIIAVVAFLALTYAVVSANKKADEKNPTSNQVTATPEPISTASDAVQPQAQAEELVVVKENPVEAAGAVHTTQEQAEPVKETTAAVVQEVKPEPSTAPAVKKDTQNQVKPNAAGTTANKAEEKPQASTAPVSAPANQTGTGTPKVSSPAAIEKPVQETKIATKEDTQPATAAPAVKEESKKSITFTKKEEVKVVTPAVTPSSASSSSSSSSSASEEFCEEGC